MILEPLVECLPLEELGRLRQERLASVVDRLLEVDGLQGRRLREIGVGSGRDVTLDRLADLPTTSKPDIWAAYPWGLLAVPREKIAGVHASSGTGGHLTLAYYTERDLATWAQLVARSLAAAGAGRGSLVHNAAGYGMFTGGMGIHLGAVRLGAAVVPHGGGMTSRQVRLIADLRPDILTATPSYAVVLAEALVEAGVDTSCLRGGVFGAEPWSNGLRARLEQLLPLRAFDMYGLSEVMGPGVSFECSEQDGLHINEDHFVVEVIDPVSGRPVPDGTEGELTITTLTREAAPLLRYRTGDIASLDHRPCSCGRTSARMSKVAGRADDMLVVRGVNVYPSEVEAVLLEHSCVRPHYQIVVDRRALTHRLLVVCELERGVNEEGCLASLEPALHHRLGIRAEVIVVARGTLSSHGGGKAVRVAFLDNDGPSVPGLPVWEHPSLATR